MKKTLSILVVFAFFLLAACNPQKNAKLEVWLTDSPGDFEEVNIDVQDVQVHVEDGNMESGWQSLSVNKGVYNVLELTHGLETLLGEIELPPGKISQIRLKLGEQNNVVIDGSEIALTTPSGQQSGLKIQVHKTLVEGIVYKIVLDFDAARSIVKTGNGKYILKPVIRSITEAQSGAIKGVVNPAESSPAIFAITPEEDTIATAFTNESGAFLLRGIPEGSYIIGFDAKDGYADTLKNDVIVNLGEVTDMGTIIVRKEN